jgi:DNA polymerase-3 subunit delta'
MAENTITPPRNNPFCYGHEAVEQDLLNALRAGRMPHTLLFEGPKGIGKATFAYRFARFILTQYPQSYLEARSFEICPETPSFKRISSGGHADLYVVEPGRNKDGQKNKYIQVDEIRKAIAFSRKTPGEGGWRVIIVDSADDLNKNSANALLKLMEEPPTFSTLILLSSNRGKLPVTMTSRCQRYSFGPLSEENLNKIISHYPNLAFSEDVRYLASGSAGKAANIAFKNSVTVYRGMLTFVCLNLSHQGEKAIYGLQSVLDNNPENFEIFCEYFYEFIGKYIKFKMGAQPATFLNEGDVFEKMNHALVGEWVDIWHKSVAFLQEAKIYNLDWRTTLTAIVNIFEKRIN